MSDSKHSSPGSKEFWQAHIRRNKFSIYRLNLDTTFKRNANRFKGSEIWANSTNNSFNTILNNSDYLIEDDFENLGDLNDDFEEVSEELNLNDISNEELNIEIKNENSSMENR